MADLVEAGLDVAFKNPLGRTLFAKHIEALGNGIGSRSVSPEPVGVRIGSRLRDRIKREQIKRLHRSVFDRRNPERAHLPVGFGNVQSPERERLIASLLQVLYG